ncbi:ORF6N domain-containing protein [Dethiothermospora halolimnae]|uniref:ORF6N domain-containing protein n=1 Tax=Dethiothermospora halolimnae TaxID=3114390 RepID=UPI003CCBA487
MNKELKLLGRTKVCGEEIPKIAGGFGDKKKCMLASTIAKLHNKKVKAVNEDIRNNIQYFRTGIDIIDLRHTSFAYDLVESGFMTQNALNATKNLWLLSERGYAKVIKVFDDELSWRKYDKILDEYFEVKEEVEKTGAYITDKADPEMLRNKADEIEKLKIASDSAKFMSGLLEEAGMDSKIKLLTAKKFYQTAGIDLPIEIEEETKFYDTKQIAKELKIETKSGKPAYHAVSQIVKMLDLSEAEQQAVWESNGSWQGTVVKYRENVIGKVKEWLEENSYPSKISYTTKNGKEKNYHVVYSEVDVA